MFGETIKAEVSDSVDYSPQSWGAFWSLFRFPFLSIFFRGCTHNNTGGLYRGDVSETLGTCLIWSVRSSWAIWYLSLNNPPKMRQCGPKTIFGWQTEGGLKKNGFTQISFVSKTFKTNFMSWDTDLGSISPLPLLKLHIKFSSLGKRRFWSILGGCMIFFSFGCRIIIIMIITQTYIAHKTWHQSASQT